MSIFDFDVVKIVDDEAYGAEISQIVLEDLGIRTELIIDGHYNTVEQLLTKVMSGHHERMGVLCDHKLMPRALANFYGSELVAGLYHRKIPAILLTQFADDEIDTSIRQFRRWTPALIQRDKITEDNLKLAFDFCNDELFATTPTSRRPYRTLIEIVSTAKDGEDGVAEAIIPGWDADEAVGFPIKLMPRDIITKVMQSISKEGIAYIFAEVNLGAALASELYFDSFEWADKPKGLTLNSLFTKP